MRTARSLLAPALLVLTAASVCGGQNLSSYRGFQIGASVESVMTKVEAKPSDLRTLHKEPALIEELEWNPQRFAVAPPMSESLRQMRFSFYNDELYKMVVLYDYVRTEGLTPADIIEALASGYGKETVPDATRTVSISNTFFEDTHKVLALWEDAEYSSSFFRTYAGSFGIVIVSKLREGMAKAAATESADRAHAEAPQRERERRALEEEEREATRQKSRLENKPRFRP